MDFLDSIDFDSSHKRCDRVRSWYLYEQYKTLEKNQLDAAYRLKNKTYQERILKQELSERRARRRLCDQFGDCQCESGLERKIHSAHSKAPVSVSDKLFESFHELYEEYELDPVYVYTHDSKSSKNCDDIKSSDRYDASFEESLNSVVENVTIDDYLSDDIKGELEFVKKNIADNINLQLETVKENIECLEKYTKIDMDKITDDDSFSEHYKVKDNILFQKKLNANKQNSVLLMWSKLVAFAYNIIKLNHDNCYSDCSSQFLIGILACDVLRRGICNMCYILQPYVSPIKYASSDSDISLDSWNTVERNKINYNEKTLKPTNSIKFMKCKKIKPPNKMRSLGRKYHSESKWLNHSKHSCGNNCMCKFEYRGFSEPWCSTNRFCEDMSYYKYNKWPETFAKCNLSEVNRHKCRCLKLVVNPIKQLARYIDNVLQDITE